MRFLSAILFARKPAITIACHVVFCADWIFLALSLSPGSVWILPGIVASSLGSCFQSLAFFRNLVAPQILRRDYAVQLRYRYKFVCSSPLIPYHGWIYYGYLLWRVTWSSGLLEQSLREVAVSCRQRDSHWVCPYLQTRVLVTFLTCTSVLPPLFLYVGRYPRNHPSLVWMGKTRLILDSNAGPTSL